MGDLEQTRAYARAYAHIHEIVVRVLVDNGLLQKRPRARLELVEKPREEE